VVPVAGEWGGWVPAVDRAPIDDDLLSAWAPRPRRGRHRTADDDPAGHPGELAGGRPVQRAWPDAPGDGDGGKDDGDGGNDDGDGGDDDGDRAGAGAPAGPLVEADRAGVAQSPDGTAPPEETVAVPQPDDDDDAEPVGVRALRINGRWGRFAELWVPESMRGARLDPGRRGMLVLVFVAAAAAIVAAVGVWRDRPEPRPVETAVVAAVSGEVSEASASPAAAVGSADADPAAAATGSAAPTEILVSVTGLVANPGVVRLPPQARVADAIAAAGGTRPGANLTGMNLAAKLADGDSVVVTDTPTAAAAPAPAGSGGAAGGSSGGPATPAGGLVNLNTADEAALDTLPGVGPVMAQNILAWRETNGKFASVEQLQEISGIGPSRYAQLAPLVTVG
jgi:competence protein ComEA